MMPITPFPVRLTLDGEFEASLTIEIIPEELPLVVGEKETPNVTDCPAPKTKGNGGSSSGSGTPTAYPVPVTLMAVIVMGVAFVLKSEIDWLDWLPITMSPKLMDAGLTARFTAGPIPVPARVIVVGEFEALLVKLTLPFTTPPAVGMNTTLKLVDCPGFKFTGNVSPVTVNSAPVMARLVIVTALFPVFVTVIICELAEPMMTVPKSIAVGLALNVNV